AGAARGGGPAARGRSGAARRRAARCSRAASSVRPSDGPSVRLGGRGGAGRVARVSEVVTITRIAVGGDGVGRLADGRAVFVPRTAPGDRVALQRGVKLHRSFARGDVAEVVAPGPARVPPPCPHFVRDGGSVCPSQALAH